FTGTRPDAGARAYRKRRLRRAVTRIAADRRRRPYRGGMGRVLGMVAGAGLLLAALGGAHAAPPPPPRLPRLPSLRTSTDAPTVQQHPDGTLRRVDEEGRFQGIIHPDGRVELRDLPDARVEFETGIRT